MKESQRYKMKDSKEKKEKTRNKQTWPGLRGCAKSA